MLKTAHGAFGDEEVVDKAAVRATEASDKALKTQEIKVDKALAQQKREEAEAETDKAKKCTHAHPFESLWEK